jgi:hypothetical protein
MPLLRKRLLREKGDFLGLKNDFILTIFQKEMNVEEVENEAFLSFGNAERTCCSDDMTL